MDIRTLSKKLGLSITTVSRALGGYSDVSEKTRERVKKLANKYNYSPNPYASRLASGKSKINWEDFNWPPCANYYHFDIDECDDETKPIIKKIHTSWLILPILAILNLVNSIIQTAAGYNGLRILSSI